MSDLTIECGGLSLDPLDYDELGAGSVQPTNPLTNNSEGDDVFSVFAAMVGVSPSDLASPVDPEGLVGGGVFGNVIGDEPIEATEKGHEQTIQMGYAVNPDLMTFKP